MKIILVFLCIFCVSCVFGDDGGKEYFGVLMGHFNTFHHDVGGTVYAVNATTILIKNFYYDGLGKDAYFWGGSGGNGPGPNGFIIPDQWGRYKKK
jgi:hypothetical protein